MCSLCVQIMSEIFYKYQAMCKINLNLNLYVFKLCSKFSTNTMLYAKSISISESNHSL